MSESESNIAEEAHKLNIEQRFVEGKGRCLFASLPFKKGDIIFEESPLICCQFAWNKAYGYLACDYCMRPLESVEENVARLTSNKCIELPYLELDSTTKSNHRSCDNCGEKYCSEVCKENAWKQYHRLLCHKFSEGELLYELVEIWKQMHYPPETMNIMLLARLIATVESAEDQELVYNNFMQFCHLAVNEDETLAHNLLGEKFQKDIIQLWSVFSTVMQERCRYTRDRTFINALLSRESFIKMLSLIGRNGQGIGTSILAEWANKVVSLDVSLAEKSKIDHLVDSIYSEIDEHVGTFMNNEGSGLYLLQSYINHSCAPNAKITFPFNNSRLVLVAKRDIMPGEEITITYLDKCSRKRSCHSRRKILQSHYLFTCMCSKCVTDSTTEPDITSEEEDDESCEDVEM